MSKRDVPADHWRPLNMQLTLARTSDHFHIQFDVSRQQLFRRMSSKLNHVRRFGFGDPFTAHSSGGALDLRVSAGAAVATNKLRQKYDCLNKPTERHVAILLSRFC